MEKAEFNEKMEAVAGLLSLTWAAQADPWTLHGYLVGQSQIKISARNDDYSHKGRIAFFSFYPRGKSNYGYSSGHIEITVAEDKTPEQITKDLQRRFLPAYLENLKKVIEANQQADDYETWKLATIKKVADYLGDKIGDNNSIYPAIKEIYRIRPDGGGYLQFEIRQCTPEKVIEIIEILRK